MVTPDHIRTLCARVFEDGWKTCDLPPLPVRKTTKLGDTAVRVGRWRQDLPSKNGVQTMRQRKAGRPAYHRCAGASPPVYHLQARRL